jgi:flagellar motor switch protein FliG
MRWTFARRKIVVDRVRRHLSSMDGTALKMALNPPSNLDKAAILLRRLPPPSLAKVLEIVGPENSSRLRIAIEAVSHRPDLAELDEQVMQEFREMQREVRESLRDAPQRQRMQDAVLAAVQAEAAADPSSSQTAAGRLQQDQTIDGADPVAQLLKTPPVVLAVALQKETPRAMALVLRELPTEFASRVLEQFPPDRRQEVFMFLAARSTVHPAVTRTVLQAVAKVCLTVDPAMVGQQDNRFKTLIGILQTVEREERLRLMEALSEQDEELAAQIDDNLYDYTDLLRIQDRSVQKLLTQLEQKVVAMALKTAPVDIVQKVMKNLSERVRGTLNEEMELLNSVSPSKMEQARREIANVIRTQDKDGTLMWIE